MKIKKLSEKTINRIAAGEVIERPLSVVKELVENAIDASASNIEIELERGGRNLVSVADDGDGITKEDLIIAIERHATSKLNEDDICNINFHGFRGEALPSIASVSRMKIISKHVSSVDAWQIEVLGGEIQELLPASLRFGTRVEVRDLFYFTPNRLKFLKSENSEISACTELINKFALCHPNIAFKLVSDGKVLLNYKSYTDDQNHVKRVSDILGQDFLSNSATINHQQEYMSFHGHISLPTYSRKTTANYLTYVNKRIVRDKFFIGALKAAYQGLIPHDRYPMCVLFLNIDPYEVDVNVHPTKAEVRFKDENFIRRVLISQIRKTIAISSAPQQVIQPAIRTESEASNATFEQPKNINRTLKTYKPATSIFNQTFKPKERDNLNLEDDSSNKFRSFHQSTFTAEDKPIKISEKPYQAANEIKPVDNTSSEPEDVFPLGFAKCQINNTFIISETKDGFIIIDQHAAHERLVLEKMKQNIQNGKIHSQPLLIPEVVEVGPPDAEKLLSFAHIFQKFGLIIERNGLSQILVRETPYLLGKVDIKELIIDLSDYISEYETPHHLEEKLDEICGNIACHSSIRAGRKLSIEEMNALLREMENTQFSAQCNHGRPTFKKLSLKELHNMFERT